MPLLSPRETKLAGVPASFFSAAAMSLPLVLAGSAAGSARIGTRRPIAEKWKKFVAVVLACAAVLAYYNGFRNGYDKAYHRHELFHYAARADTALDAPRWLTEGVADYVARPAPTAPVRIDTTHLPSDADFTGTPEELSAAYDRAWLFARFVADRYGAPAQRLLYLRGAGYAHADAATALRDVLGTGPDELLAQWGEWAR